MSSWVRLDPMVFALKFNIEGFLSILGGSTRAETPEKRLNQPNLTEYSLSRCAKLKELNAN